MTIQCRCDHLLHIRQCMTACCFPAFDRRPVHICSSHNPFWLLTPGMTALLPCFEDRMRAAHLQDICTGPAGGIIQQ